VLTGTVHKRIKATPTRLTKWHLIVPVLLQSSHLVTLCLYKRPSECESGGINREREEVPCGDPCQVVSSGTDECIIPVPLFSISTSMGMGGFWERCMQRGLMTNSTFTSATTARLFFGISLNLDLVFVRINRRLFYRSTVGSFADHL
jgi:hypothetical protein